MTNLSAAVITTFPNNAWDIYAKRMLVSFVQYWPAAIPLMVCLDDDLLLPDVQKIIRPQDCVTTDRTAEHEKFIKDHAAKDDLQNYRKQAVRFCHKVFHLGRCMWAWEQTPEEARPKYQIWLDADVVTTRKVTVQELQSCMPKEGDAVAYLGRKDWPHTEGGWYAFDIKNGGMDIVKKMLGVYASGHIFNMDEWHDCWVFDRVREGYPCTNLTEGKPGTEIWQESPMAAWSNHYKGPEAKKNLFQQPVGSNQPQVVEPIMKGKPGGLTVQTQNAIPHGQIREHILENQQQIKHWIRPCVKNNEKLVVVSAGPLMLPEELFEEVKKKRKIVAVKHALERLQEAGIKPWAVILLDPREHVYNFVTDPDQEVLWFVASQVNPRVVRRLLDKGCKVWGYHAAVGADEDLITGKQIHSIVNGGSATATRGLALMDMLGFRNFRLYGYDLSYPDKPDLGLRDDKGQPKYLEINISTNHHGRQHKLTFWTEPQLFAQFQEFDEILRSDRWTIEAFGLGVVPFMVRNKNASDLKRRISASKLKQTSYRRLLNCPTQRQTNRQSKPSLKLPQPSRHKRTKDGSLSAR